MPDPLALELGPFAADSGGSKLGAWHSELAILTMPLFTSIFLFIFNLEVSKALPMSRVSAELLF